MDLLAAHHSNPKYKEDMNTYYWKGSGANQWGSWSPQMPKTQPRKKVKEEKGAKDNKKEGVVKPYDSTSMAGSASSDGQSTEMVFMKEFLSFMKESGAEVTRTFPEVHAERQDDGDQESAEKAQQAAETWLRRSRTSAKL